MTDPPKRLTTSQAAKRLGVSRHTAKRWFYLGILTGIQPNSRIMIDPESVEKALGRSERRERREAKRRAAVQPIRRQKGQPGGKGGASGPSGAGER